MEKWPVGWAGMLWEKMQSRAAAAAGSSSNSSRSSSNQSYRSIPGVRPLPEGSWGGRTSQIGLDGPLRRRDYCWLRRLGDRVAGTGWMWRGLRDGPNLQRNSTPATIREFGRTTEMGLLSRDSSRWLIRSIRSNTDGTGSCAAGGQAQQSRVEQSRAGDGRGRAGGSKDLTSDW